MIKIIKTIKTIKTLKTIFHWVKAIIKIILLIVLMPLILLYFWLKINVYRFTVRREFRKCNMDKYQIKYLMSDVAKLSDGLMLLKN